MASSSQSGAVSGHQALAAYRDAQGFLPFADCDKCGTRLIGRISQQPNNKGKRFYKCPMLEYTSMACRFYMFEEHYVQFLVKEGLLPTCFASRGMRPDVSVTNVSLKEEQKDAADHLGEVKKGIERSCSNVENVVTALKDAQKATADRMQDLGKKVELVVKMQDLDKKVELVVFVGLANLFVLVLVHVLLVLLVK